MEFDPSRPCGAKAARERVKNAYTRKELEKIARSRGVKGIKGKSMKELCEELKILISPGSGVSRAPEAKTSIGKPRPREEKVKGETLETKLGFPFSSLKPGTFEQLGGRLQKTHSGVLLISGNHWRVLDQNLKVLKSLEVEDNFHKVSMFPEEAGEGTESKFVAISEEGLKIWDLDGKVQEVINEEHYYRGNPDKIDFAVPMNSDEVLYIQESGLDYRFEEDLKLYSSIHGEEIILSSGEKYEVTEALFRIDNTRYFRTYFTSPRNGGESDTVIVVGNTTTDEILQKRVKKTGNLKFIQVSPTRYLGYSSTFYVFDVVSEIRVRKLESKVKGGEDFAEMVCAVAVDENRVVMTDGYGVLLYFLDLEKDEILKVRPDPGEFKSGTAPINYECVMTVAQGKLFYSDPYHQNSLLAFDPRDIRRLPPGPALDMPTGVVEKEKIDRIDLSELTEPDTSLSIDIFVACQATSREYLDALGASLSLMAVPRVLQDLTGKFLL